MHDPRRFAQQPIISKKKIKIPRIVYFNFFSKGNFLSIFFQFFFFNFKTAIFGPELKFMARTPQCRSTRLDKYEMLETVGEGAYGIVWKARNRGKFYTWINGQARNFQTASFWFGKYFSNKRETTIWEPKNKYF